MGKFVSPSTLINTIFLILPALDILVTHGLVGDKINMDEYGSIGFGPSGISSSSSFLASSFFLFCKSFALTITFILITINVFWNQKNTS